MIRTNIYCEKLGLNGKQEKLERVNADESLKILFKK